MLQSTLLHPITIPLAGGHAIKFLLLLVPALAASVYFTDLESDSTLRGVILPIVDFLLVCSLGIWLVNRGMDQRIGRGGADSGVIGGFSDGGDGGGGCD